jgi:hypothetical protein
LKEALVNFVEKTMSESWRILTTRYGADIRDPSSGQIAAAVDELFSAKAMNGLEHPDISFRYGLDDGAMYVLSVGIGGTGIFEKWADSDFVKLLEERQLSDLTAEKAKLLFSRLANGEFGAV